MANKIKEIAIIIEQKDALFLADNKIHELIVTENSNPYPAALADMTIVELPNNAGGNGLNDWGYKIIPPVDTQINYYIPNSVTHADIIALVAANAKFTVVNTGNILTDFNYTE